MDLIVISSPPLISVHPRLPGVEVSHAPRSGAHYVIVTPRAYTADELVDLGEWLAQVGREHNAGCERLGP